MRQQPARFRKNNRAVFKTSKGSKYTITHRDVTRERYYGGTSSGAKNIFYMDYDESEEVLEDSNGAIENVRVVKDDNRYYLVYKIGRATKRFRIHREPKVGLATLDLIVQPNGSVGDLDAAGFHIGDAVSEILWRPRG